jgi:F0F1-type ATP synthase alpha subunit
MDDPVTKLNKAMELYMGDGQVELVFGGRGSGKTASILFFIEQLYKQHYYNENEIFWVGLPNYK